MTSPDPQPASTLKPVNDPTVPVTCQKCGRFDAIEFGEHFLCADCIVEAGCACAEREEPDSGHVTDRP